MTIKTGKKGTKFEYQIVREHKKFGIDAKRVPRSGAIAELPGDVHVFPTNLGRMVCECKVRAQGFSELYKWLATNHVLFVKRDRENPLAVVPLDLWLDTLAQSQQLQEKLAEEN